MSTPLHAVKRRLPPGLLGVITGIGAAIGYVFVRAEADRLADQLNSTVVESMAYVDRRLDDLDARIGRPRPELAFVIAALAHLEPGAAVRVEADFEDAALRLRWLGYRVSADAEAPAAIVVGDPRRVPVARPGVQLVFIAEGARRSAQQWGKTFKGWRLDKIRELVCDAACEWRPAVNSDPVALTLISARA